LADKRATRRAAQRGCKVTPGRRYAVHERDGWICRICGDPVNRAAVVPALDAPVIDHVVPLARGGAHAPHNWQTAHFYCNSAKRDLMDFDSAEVPA
jgi:5-methylcytosine-specific restriction endonuclease McrA